MSTAGDDAWVGKVNLDEYTAFTKVVWNASAAPHDAVGCFNAQDAHAGVRLATLRHHVMTDKLREAYILTKAYRCLVGALPAFDPAKTAEAAPSACSNCAPKSALGPVGCFSAENVQAIAKACEYVLRSHVPRLENSFFKVVPESATLKRFQPGSAEPTVATAGSVQEGGKLPDRTWTLGKLVLQFPTPFEGGGLEVMSDGDAPTVVESGAQVVFVLATCATRDLPVSSGLRATLEFDVLLGDAEICQFVDFKDPLWSTVKGAPHFEEAKAQSFEQTLATVKALAEPVVVPSQDSDATLPEDAEPEKGATAKDPEAAQETAKPGDAESGTPVVLQSTTEKLLQGIVRDIGSEHVAFALTNKYALNAALEDLVGNDALLRDALAPLNPTLRPTFHRITDGTSHDFVFYTPDLVRAKMAARKAKKLKVEGPVVIHSVDDGHKVYPCPALLEDFSFEMILGHVLEVNTAKHN